MRYSDVFFFFIHLGNSQNKITSIQKKTVWKQATEKKGLLLTLFHQRLQNADLLMHS